MADAIAGKLGYRHDRIAVITVKSSAAVQAHSLAALRAVKIGAQVGTTNYDAAQQIIKPTQQIAVCNSNDDAKQALTDGRIQALVVDPPTTFEITGASEVPDSVIVGQLPTSGTPERFGAVLDKGSPLTACVSAAVRALARWPNCPTSGCPRWAPHPCSRDRGGRRARADVTEPASPPSRPHLDRLAHRRSRARRSTLVALASTIVFAAPAWLAITSSPGRPRGRASLFNLQTATSSLPAILDGLRLNIRVLVVGELLILLLGQGIAALGTLRGPVWFTLRAPATGYVDLCRGLPLIICLYLVGFGLPGLRLRIRLDGQGVFDPRVDADLVRRVAIVRALAYEPGLLLLDEITSALDPELVGEVLTLVREPAEGGRIILMATHEMGFARQVPDRVCFLDGGLLVEPGPPEQVLGAPKPNAHSSS